jgi:hypothetical protein
LRAAKWPIGAPFTGTLRRAACAGRIGLPQLAGWPSSTNSSVARFKFDGTLGSLGCLVAPMVLDLGRATDLADHTTGTRNWVRCDALTEPPVPLWHVSTPSASSSAAVSDRWQVVQIHRTFSCSFVSKPTLAHLGIGETTGRVSPLLHTRGDVHSAAQVNVQTSASRARRDGRASACDGFRHTRRRGADWPCVGAPNS